MKLDGHDFVVCYIVFAWVLEDYWFDIIVCSLALKNNKKIINFKYLTESVILIIENYIWYL